VLIEIVSNKTSVDLDAQRRDQVNVKRNLDRDMGQYGGGTNND